MTLPAIDYLNQNTRTEGEMKLALEDFLKGLKQVPGAGVAEQALTLATDAITPAVGASGIISVDTEAAAAADNLANIVLTNVPDGSCLWLRIANNARVVTVKHLAGGSGQISLRSAADLVMSATTQWLCVKRTGTLLEEQWRAGKEFLKNPTADSLTLTGGLNHAKTTVASATTPDIFATTVGNYIDYTGTVTCTGFAAAPQAGAWRHLHLAGAAPFTASANLLIPGTSSGNTYTCAAADIVHVYAKTTTSFELRIEKADGTALVVAASSSSVMSGSADNLKTIRNGATTSVADVTADAVVLVNASGISKRHTGVSVSPNINTAGPALLGRDQAAAFGTSVYFYIWLLSNGSAITAVASLSTSLATVVSNMAGVGSGLYTYGLMVSAQRTTAGSGIIMEPHIQQGRTWWRNSVPFTDVSAGGATTPTSYTLTVPPLAMAYYGGAKPAGDANRTALWNSANMGANSVTPPLAMVAFQVNVPGLIMRLPIVTAQTGYYLSDAASADVYTYGWDIPGNLN